MKIDKLNQLLLNEKNIDKLFGDNDLVTAKAMVFAVNIIVGKLTIYLHIMGYGDAWAYADPMSEKGNRYQKLKKNQPVTVELERRGDDVKVLDIIAKPKVSIQTKPKVDID